MCDAINKNVIFDTIPAAKITINTNIYVNNLNDFLTVSKRLLSIAEPDVCGAGGSENESHNFVSLPDGPLFFL